VTIVVPRSLAEVEREGKKKLCLDESAAVTMKVGKAPLSDKTLQSSSNGIVVTFTKR